MNLKNLSSARREILEILKVRGPRAIADLAQSLGVSREAVRQQLAQLEREGWVERWTPRRRNGRQGRPRRLFRLTSAGDHLFPKQYDDLAVELVDTLADTLGPAALRQTLAALVDARVERWRPAMRGLSLEDRLRALEGIYQEHDPFTHVEVKGDALCLVERNCPFLSVALRRPALCSVTVATLSRLLGYRVIREERFQDGDGCCVFRVLTDQPRAPDAPAFDWEPEETAARD